MAKWKELPQIVKGKLNIGLRHLISLPNKCLNCSTASYVLSMERSLCAGFGDVRATKNGDEVYSEYAKKKELEVKFGGDYTFEMFPDAQFIEDMAAKEPDNDWRIQFDTPMHGETYQRHKDGIWYCIESNQGFA